jgi:hypothetical protein
VLLQGPPDVDDGATARATAPGRRWAGHRLTLGDGAALSIARTSDSRFVGRRSTRRGRGSAIRGGCGVLREIFHGTGRSPTRALKVDRHLGGRGSPTRLSGRSR